MERYPWVEDWTPVNEPLTTARFSALYGHWHPHQRSEGAFWRALLNQIDGVRLAMREIRRVRPDARLVQTEDLGKVYATRQLNYQAEFENWRRWATWDLLFGRVTREHPLFERMTRFGFDEKLRAIADDPCPPDIVGVNHYLTSDRFLDHRPERYPDVPVGGNAFMQYVDVEAVRVAQPPPQGLEGALREAWARYGAEIAVTEVQLACTREDQARWFVDAWRTARRLREEGVGVGAVTAWSLLGAYDWDSLLVHREGRYEPGAFDVSSGGRRPTALARVLKEIADGEALDPEFEAEGWWRRDLRLRYAPVRREEAPPRRAYAPPTAARRPLLITGATGTLGQALARACCWRNLNYVLTDRRTLNLSDPQSIEAALTRCNPWAVINAAGWVRVDDAEANAEACMNANAHGARTLAQACAARGLPLASFSSDLVFDGKRREPYDETAAPRPLNVYGKSKLEAERALMAASARALIIRTSAFFSPFDAHNFAAWAVRELAAGREIAAAADVVVSPTYTPQLADAVLDLMLDQEQGLWHLANEGAVSWFEFARMIATATRLDADMIRPRSGAELGWRAKRPRYSALTSARGRLLTSLDEAVHRFAHCLNEVGFMTEFTAEQREAWMSAP